MTGSNRENHKKGSGVGSLCVRLLPVLQEQGERNPLRSAVMGPKDGTMTAVRGNAGDNRGYTPEGGKGRFGGEADLSLNSGIRMRLGNWAHDSRRVGVPHDRISPAICDRHKKACKYGTKRGLGIKCHARGGF